MYILIVGAGQVGQTVMRDLSERHEVGIIDREASVLDEVPYEIDVYAGDGLDRDLLEEASIEEADVLVTTTSDDQTNLLVCNVAQVMSDCYTVARVSDPSFVEIWSRSPGAFGVDKLVSRANLTGREVVELIGLQSTREAALDEEYFVDETILMAEYRIKESSPISGKTVGELDHAGGITFGAIIRDGDVQFATGNLVLEPKDKVTVFGTPDAVSAFGTKRVNPEDETLHRSVDILGGGDVGLQIADQLEGSGLSVRIFEQDPDRANHLSEKLPNALVLQGDVTDRSLWTEKKIPESEMVVLTTGLDERNLLCTHIGLGQEVSRIVSVVHEQQYLDIFESLDIMRAVHPREVVASSITNYIQESYADTVTMLDHEKADVFETDLSENGLAEDKTIQELREERAEPFVVGAVVRNGRVNMPRGSTRLRSGDCVVVLAPPEHAEELAELL